MKKNVPLNENWLFASRFDKACLEPSFDAENLERVCLPHNVVRSCEQYLSEDDLRVSAAYIRSLTLDEKYNGCKIGLKFESVLGYAEVYVNSMFVTSHKGEAPFCADITAPVKYGYENKIVVKVDSRIKKDVPSAGFDGDVLAFAGLHGKVSLTISEGGEIEDAFVKTSPALDCGREIEIEVSLSDYYPDASVETEILDSKGKTLAKFPAKAVLSRSVPVKGVVEDAELWQPDSPTLYTALITLKNADKTLDVRKVVFGFRSVSFKRDGFYLNGKKIKLNALNRYDAYPLLGRALSDSLHRYDAYVLKNVLRVNAVRTLGFASKVFIEECDRLGLLVIEDIGGDGFIGEGVWREALIENVASVVKRDRNCPSVIAWGVRVNNSADADELYFKTNKAARDNDSTRPTIGARAFMGSRLYEDVFAYNDYKGAGQISTLKKTSKLFVPYFISEHTGRNYPAKIFDNEERRLNHAIKHLKVLSAVYAHRNISGAAAMAMTDLNCPTSKGSGDNCAYYGVTDAFRQLKIAGAVYASQSGEPFMEISSNMAPDEFTGKLYVFTNCDKVRLFSSGVPVNSFFPSKKSYSALKHPPVIISDFIGNAPIASEKMTGFQLWIFKYLVKKAAKKGILGLRSIDKLLTLFLSKLLKKSRADLNALIRKYLSESDFMLEGVKDGETVLVKRFGAAYFKKRNMTLAVSDKTLKAKGGYETALVTVQTSDGGKNPLYYDFSPVKINVSGAIELIGDSVLSLKGGRCGFFVRSKGESGKGYVGVESQWGRESLELEVEYEPVEKF